jgi:hypothetical protein
MITPSAGQADFVQPEWLRQYEAQRPVKGNALAGVRCGIPAGDSNYHLDGARCDDCDVAGLLGRSLGWVQDRYRNGYIRQAMFDAFTHVWATGAAPVRRLRLVGNPASGRGSDRAGDSVPHHRSRAARHPMNRPPVTLSMGMGVDSAALLTRWILDPASRTVQTAPGRVEPFDLRDLTVVTAVAMPKMEPIVLSPQVIEILSWARVDGNRLHLDGGPTDRALSVEVSKVLNAVGWFWNRDLRAWVKVANPVAALRQALHTGVVDPAADGDRPNRRGRRIVPEDWQPPASYHGWF